MKYMVVFKATRYERDRLGNPTVPQALDCYMVSNKGFDTVAEAKRYAEAMPLPRQARVVDTISFRCPMTGEWREGW